MDGAATEAPVTFTFRFRPSVEAGRRAVGLRRRGLADRRTIATPIVALCIVSVLLILPPNPADAYAGIVGLGIGFLFLALSFNSLGPWITDRRRAQWNADVKDGQSVTINDAGIRTDGPDGAMYSFTPWHRFRELRDDGEIVMFWRSPGWALWLDSSAFSSAKERSELIAFARAHLPTPTTPARPEGDAWN
jgi:hypothetical protein